MRVLVVASDFTAQGIGIAVHGLCSALGDRGHDVRLIVRDSRQDIDKDIRDPNYEIEVGHSVFIKPAVWPRTMKQLVSKISGIKGFGPDAVLCTDLEEAGALGIAAAKVSGVPTMAFAWGDDWSESVEGIPTRARMVVRNAEAFIPVTRFARKHIIDIGFDERRAEILYPGVDNNVFQERAHRRASVAGPLRLLTCSALEMGSGVDEVINAFNFLLDQGEDVRLTIVGSGHRMTALKRSVKRRALEGLVAFKGKLGFGDLPDIYREHDVLITSPVSKRKTITPHRGDMLRILEAAATGLATVGTRVGGIPEMLKISGGTISKTPKPDDLAGAILEASRSGPAKRIRGWDEVGLELEVLIRKTAFE